MTSEASATSGSTTEERLIRIGGSLDSMLGELDVADWYAVNVIRLAGRDRIFAEG